MLVRSIVFCLAAVLSQASPSARNNFGVKVDFWALKYLRLPFFTSRYYHHYSGRRFRYFSLKRRCYRWRRPHYFLSVRRTPYTKWRILQLRKRRNYRKE